MTKLTETQTIILSAGAQRSDNIALPLPKGLAGAAAKMAVTKMVEHGWLQEVDANLRRGEPLWRETGDGHQNGVPATQSALIALVQEWFVQNSRKGEVPDESTIRKRLAPLWRKLRGEEPGD